VINRRNLLVALGAAAVAPRAVLAQSKKAPVVIGWLSSGSRESGVHRVAALKEGLAALGWKDGSQIVIEERWADGRFERLQSLAEDLAKKGAAVIVASGSPAVVAATKGAPAIPVVVGTGDALSLGLAASLARPGGMVTGLSVVVTEVNNKHLELLLDAVPKLRRIGFLVDSGNTFLSTMMQGARRAIAQHQVEGRFEEAANPDEIEPAMVRLAKQGAQALIVTGSPMLLAERRSIVKLAMANRWPTIAGQNEVAEQGALLSYGAERVALYRRSAYYVDRILKGAKPGDLPIEQPTRFELVLNMKTAKTLGLTIPQPFLMRVDRVIE
jgi:putative ABC transport system substrate-binding protein